MYVALCCRHMLWVIGIADTSIQINSSLVVSALGDNHPAMLTLRVAAWVTMPGIITSCDTWDDCVYKNSMLLGCLVAYRERRQEAGQAWHTMSSLIDEGPNCAELCRKTCRSFGAWLSPSCLSLLCMRSKAAASSCKHSLLVGQVLQDRLLKPQTRNKAHDLRTRGRYSAGDLCKHAPRSGSNNLTSCRSTLSLDWSLISASLQGSGQIL